MTWGKVMHGFFWMVLLIAYTFFFSILRQYRTCLSLRTWKREYRTLAYYWMLACGTVLKKECNTGMQMRYTIACGHMQRLIILEVLRNFFAPLLWHDWFQKLFHIIRPGWLVGHHKMNSMKIINKSSNILRKIVNFYWKFRIQVCN